MSNKKLLATVLSTSVLLSAGAAYAEVSANIGVTSNYLWRGVSQTQDDVAVSGGVDYSHESGFYVGAWASNVNFGTTETVDVVDGGGSVIGTATVNKDDHQYELDVYAGFAGEAGGFGYDIGVVHYAYPEADGDADFTELAVSGSFSVVTIGANYTFHSEVDDGLFTEGDIYYFASAGLELPQDFGLSFTVGHYAFDVDGDVIDGDKLDVDYTHYQADLSKSAGDFGDFTLTVSKAEEESGDDETKLVLSWAKTF